MPQLTRYTTSRIAQRPERKPSNPSFYHKSSWQRVRRLYLSRSPLCEAHLLAGMTAENAVDCTRNNPVDHVVRIESGGAPLSDLNLMTLCLSCHAAKSAMEANGYEVEGQGPEGERIPTREGREKILTLLASRI